MAYLNDGSPVNNLYPISTMVIESLGNLHYASQNANSERKWHREDDIFTDYYFSCLMITCFVSIY
jgi:hypothetical protein